MLDKLEALMPSVQTGQKATWSCPLAIQLAVFQEWSAFLLWKSSVRYSLSVETETEIALDSGLKGHLLDLPTAPPQKEVFWFGSDWFGVVWFGLIFGIRH